VFPGVHEDVSSLAYAVGIENLLELEGKALFHVDSLSEEYGNNSALPW
jgi:hypothetical protein